MTFRYLALGIAVVVCLVARTGHAQQVYGPITGGTLANPTPIISPTNGVPLSDSAVLHGGVSVEGGYDSNIFYNDDEKVGSAILRVNPFLDLTNASRTGDAPSGLYFDLRAGMSYREYLNSDANIRRLRAVQPTASVNLEHNSGGTVVVGIADTYARVQDAPYTRLGANNDLIIRDNNLAAAQLRWSPGGGRLQGTLRLTNTIDWFETDQLKAGSSMTNEAMLDLSWRWLPKTALYVQVRQGWVKYLNTEDDSSGLVPASLGKKQTSYPLRAMVGIRGLITEKTSIALAVGYQNAFYEGGQTTTGFFGSTTAAGELIVMPLQTTKITLGLHHDFQNSVVGNFFYDDGVYASVSHQLVSRLIAQAWGAYDHRRYYGLPTGMDPRVDDTLQGTALLDFYIRAWAYIGASYSVVRNRSDYLPDQHFSGTNYTKQLVFGHVGLTY